MKYYFAIITLDSVRTADYIYKNCDGKELELTNMTIDLRFVPED